MYISITVVFWMCWNVVEYRTILSGKARETCGQSVCILRGRLGETWWPKCDIHEDTPPNRHVCVCVCVWGGGGVWCRSAYTHAFQRGVCIYMYGAVCACMSHFRPSYRKLSLSIATAYYAHWIDCFFRQGVFCGSGRWTKASCGCKPTGNNWREKEGKAWLVKSCDTVILVTVTAG